MLAGLASEGLIRRVRSARRKRRKDGPEGLHEDLDKVALSEHEVVLESFEVVEEMELVEEDVEKSLRGDQVGQRDGSLETRHVGVLQRCVGRNKLAALKIEGENSLPVIRFRVTTQSGS